MKGIWQKLAEKEGTAQYDFREERVRFEDK